MAAPPLPEARLERTLLVALIAFTFDRLAYDRPLTPAECQPLHPSPRFVQGGWPRSLDRLQTAEQTGELLSRLRLGHHGDSTSQKKLEGLRGRQARAGAGRHLQNRIQKLFSLCNLVAPSAPA